MTSFSRSEVKKGWIRICVTPLTIELEFGACKSKGLMTALMVDPGGGSQCAADRIMLGAEITRGNRRKSQIAEVSASRILAYYQRVLQKIPNE